MDYTKMFDLSRKIAVVTGASGLLGSELSFALARCGADVVVVGRNMEKLKKISDRIRAIHGKSSEMKVDVTNESDVKKLSSKVLERFGRIDILVACAGANILGAAKNFRLENWEKLMRINAQGTFLCNREIGKVMIDQNHGKIVNISSIRGWFATSASTLGYSASKASVNMITRVLACEWAQFNINVNAVAPAMIATGMHTATPDGEALKLDPKILEGVARRTPMKRLAQPEDICGTVIFLASEASAFITGQVIYVDGGASVWAA